MRRSICILLIAAILCVGACKPADHPAGQTSVVPRSSNAVTDAAASLPVATTVSTAAPVPTLEPAGSSVPTPEPTPTLEPAGSSVPTPEPTPTLEPVGSSVPAPTPIPTLEPAGSSVPTATPAPTASPSPSPMPDSAFTLAWATDTQIMMSHYREMLPAFMAMCQWTAEQAEERNIVAFLHTGDMVDECDNRNQWGFFSDGMSLIASKMPLFLTLGNHDYYDSTLYPVWKDQFFFKQIPPDHCFRDGVASYLELSVGNTDLLLIQVAFRDKNNLTALQWLKNVCDAHPDIPVILVTHGYLSNDGRLMYAAEIMEKALVSKCPNIRLILCGHSRGIARKTFTYDDDGDGVRERTVHVLMHDLQLDRERFGYFNLLTYDPDSNTLYVDSYAPILDDYVYDDENPDAERFTIENVF